MNIFVTAAKQKLRFPSNKGELTAEQLWDLPLQAKSGFDLDSVAKAVNSQLKAVTEDSFVSTTASPAKTDLQIKLDIVKFVIADKIAENTATRDAALRKAQREKLMGVLADKQDEALKSLTPAELQAQIDALG